MRRIIGVLMALFVVMAVGGCGGDRSSAQPAGAQLASTSSGGGDQPPVQITPVQSTPAQTPPAQVEPPSKGTPDVAASDVVPEADVTKLLNLAATRPYTVTWHVSAGPDVVDTDHSLWMLGDGRQGVLPNGDRYVLFPSFGFAHRGGQAWYLTVGSKGEIEAEGPWPGNIPQRPFVQACEAVPANKYGVLDAIWRNSTAFERRPAESGEEDWVSAVPPRKSSVQLFGEDREILGFTAHVKKFGDTYLPVAYEISWWGPGKVTMQGSYQWAEPTFPSLQ